MKDALEIDTMKIVELKHTSGPLRYFTYPNVECNIVPVFICL